VATWKRYHQKTAILLSLFANNTPKAFEALHFSNVQNLPSQVALEFKKNKKCLILEQKPTDGFKNKFN
jgi:hypothetical protein